MKSAPQTYQGHDGDVNAVCFLPDGKRFGTASDDGTCRLFDTRTGYQLQMYSHPRGDSVKVLAVAFSSSGRLMFAAYDNEDCYVWDTIMSEVMHIPHLSGATTCCRLSFTFLAIPIWKRYAETGLVVLPPDKRHSRLTDSLTDTDANIESPSFTSLLPFY